MFHVEHQDGGRDAPTWIRQAASQCIIVLVGTDPDVLVPYGK